MKKCLVPDDWLADTCTEIIRGGPIMLSKIASNKRQRTKGGLKFNRMNNLRRAILRERGLGSTEWKNPYLKKGESTEIDRSRISFLDEK
jgi:hypothetical protein